MINGFVKAVLKEVKVQYPHISMPSVLKAKIVSVKKLEAYEKESIIEWDGIEHLCKIKNVYYSYNIKILNKNGEENSNYPGLPNVRCKDKYEVGDAVTVALLEGELEPVIIGGYG